MRRGPKFSLIFVLIILLIAGVFVFSAVKFLETAMLSPGSTYKENSGKTIIRNGKEYFPRQDIMVVLLIGTDAEGIVQSSNSYNNKASADMVALMIFDESSKECSILSLNRDTMMDIPVLGIGGKSAGSVYAQLATSHNYGSGLADSCENTKTAVSNFLYGLSIDYYLSLTMDGIGVLNDGVGGVEVTVTDDFSEVSSDLPMGETLILRGDQAYTYVRSRMNVGTQLNVSRMDRQKQYMEGFMSSLSTALDNNTTFFTELWSQLSDYVVTDCTPVVMNQLATQYKDYKFIGSLTPEGENILGDRYYEFYADLDALDRLILDLFYEEK